MKLIIDESPSCHTGGYLGRMTSKRHYDINFEEKKEKKQVVHHQNHTELYTRSWTVRLILTL